MQAIVAPNVKQSAPSLYAKWFAVPMEDLWTVAAMFAASLTASGTAKSLQCALNPNVK